MTLRPTWLLMTAPRVGALAGMLLLIVWASVGGEFLFLFGSALLGLGAFGEGIFRIVLRCPHCGESPYSVPISELSFIKQPAIPASSCLSCGEKFE
jgi:hypothetical protein